MTAKVAKSPAAAVRARLLVHARQHGEDYQRILTRYAIERLLFRLSQTEAAHRYVLKGAMLFATWPAHAFRPTGDLDLLGYGDPEPAVVGELFTRICRVESPDDGIGFDPASLKAEVVREAGRYPGIELSLKGELAGAIIRLRVDIGFGDHVYPAPKREDFPSLLPELPRANLLMYPPETVVAEKFEAMIRFGHANSRIKDFHDIWVAIHTFPFDLASLLEAVSGTLRRRETTIPTEIPVALTDAFAEIAENRGLWSGFLRRNPPTVKPPPFSDLHQELRRFFSPVIAGLGAPGDAEGRWDPNVGAWMRK